MSVAVDFFSNFSKRKNSTLRPTASPSTINCLLKDNCSILNPVLEIRGSGSTFSPVGPGTNYNYCKIDKFGRFYYVDDWEYTNSMWICRLKVDTLATYKTNIGGSTHYILRSAYAKDINIVDTLYPPLSWQPNNYIDSADFQFARSFAQGTYVLGVANGSPNCGAISYYTVSSVNMANLLAYMIPQASDLWSSGFTGMTDTLYRSIYGAFDYIKSCKWFPISSLGGGGATSEYIKFGNYTSNVYGEPLSKTVTDWTTNSRTVYLPSSWLSFDAKYRTKPYAHIYLVVNPWGIIELEPLDFTDSRQIRLDIYPDCISGDCMLKIYKVVGSTSYFITEKNTTISVDINLSSASFNAGGILQGAVQTIGSIADVASGVGVSSIMGAVSGIGNSLIAATPTMSGSIGNAFTGARAMEGTINLIYTSTYFASEDNAHFGSPLCDSRQISTLPGYILCQDGDISLAGAYESEISEVSEFMTSGFYYE